MAAPKVMINLPNLLKAYGGPSAAVNPHHDDARRASSAWLRGYHLLSEEKQALYECDNYELLASFAHPYSGYDQLRLLCDLFNILFMTDTITDHQSHDAARGTCNILLAAFRDLSMDDNLKFSKAISDFSARYNAMTQSASASQFAAHAAEYLASVVSQARLRETKEVLGLDLFISHRRDNSALRLAFDLLEPASGVTLPCEVYASDKFMDVYLAAVDMIWLSNVNDIYSYPMEKAMGHEGYNVVTVYMKEFNLDVQAAFDRAGREFGDLWNRFELCRLELPTFGEAIDLDVQRFVDGMKAWVVGHLHWCFETPRYFGDMKDSVKATHMVVI
ncbi:Isoprenoid synthase domain superfamily protein [Pleurotus pulmonarius]